MMKPQVGRLVLMLAVCLLLLFVFGRLKQVIEFIRPPTITSTNITIVAGQLIVEETGQLFSDGRYRITEVLRGNLTTGTTVVAGFFSDTRTGPLPTNALLILTRDEKSGTPFYEAIAKDARTGILPDTRETRERILSAPPATLAPVPWAKQLDAATAISLAQQSAALTGQFRWQAVRDGYCGWQITATPTNDAPSSGSRLYHVTDVGVVRSSM